MNDKKITRVYLELTGPNAGEQMAILQKKKVRGRNKEPEEKLSFEQMKTAEEQKDIEEEEKEEKKEEEEEKEAVRVMRQDEAPNFDTVYQYKPGLLTYQVKFDPKRPQQPYLNFDNLDKFKANRQKEAKAELLSAAIKSWYSELNEVDDDGGVDEDDGNGDGDGDGDGNGNGNGDERDDGGDNVKKEPAVSQEDYIKNFIKENTIKDKRSEEDIQAELQHEFDAQTDFVDLVADDGTEFKGVIFEHILPDEEAEPINKHIEDSEYEISSDDDDDNDDDNDDDE